jgi:hypothetical protein
VWGDVVYPLTVSRRVTNKISSPQTLKPSCPSSTSTSTYPSITPTPAQSSHSPLYSFLFLFLSLSLSLSLSPFPLIPFHSLFISQQPTNQPTNQISIPNLYLSTYLLELYCPIQSLPCKLTDSVLSETCHLEFVTKPRIQIRSRFRFRFTLHSVQ